MSGCGETPCARAEIAYRFIGFSDTEAAEFTIRRFSKGAATAADSIVINAANPVSYYRFGDTLIISSGTSSQSLRLNGDADYEFYFPRAARTIKVSEIIEPQSYKKSRFIAETKEMCINSISSCRIDGVFISPVASFNTIYLRK